MPRRTLRYAVEQGAKISMATAVARLTIISALIALGCWVVAAQAGKSAARSATASATAAILKTSAVGCDRNQVQRVYDRIDELQVRRLTASIERMKDGERVPQAPVIANAYFAIVNCPATYSPANAHRDAGPVYLQGQDERCFIHLVTSHYFVNSPPVTDPRLLRRIC